MFYKKKIYQMLDPKFDKKWLEVQAKHREKIVGCHYKIL